MSAELHATLLNVDEVWIGTIIWNEFISKYSMFKRHWKIEVVVQLGEMVVSFTYDFSSIFFLDKLRLKSKGIDKCM